MKTQTQTQALITGSLQSIAQQNKQSLAETFVNADVVILIDTSSSMMDRDENRQSRYDRACTELTRLQNTLPGKIAVISFATDPVFCPAGIPQLPIGSTDLAKALHFAKIADVANMRFIVISDGEPNDEKAALTEAAQYGGRIDVIYVGPEGGPGQKFLQRLAKSKNGKLVTAENAKELAAAAHYLLTSGAA